MRKDLIFAMGYLEAGRPAAAAAAAREALAEAPESPDAHYVLGSALREMDEPEAALAHLARAAGLAPGDAAIRHALGLALLQGGDPAAAREHLAFAAARQGDLGFRESLGACLAALGLPAEAEPHLRAVAEARSGSPSSWANLGSVLTDLGRCGEAAAAAERAIALDADHVEAHMARAFALLRAGRWAEAWPEYEWRWRRRVFREAYPPAACPRWRGERLPPDARLWVRGEQGLGDHVQFARFVPPAAERAGCPVVLTAPAPLRRLLSTVPGVAACLDRGAPDGCAAEIPMASLPGLLGARPDGLPGGVPFLRAPEAPRLPPRRGGRARIGVVWSDKPKPRSRAVDFDALAAALSGLEAEIFSLQLGEGHAARAAAAGWTDLSFLIGDFADTAALVAQVDALVSADTAALHVAGGLGVPVFVLLQAMGDWRWLQRRTDSPWYPSARLLRQETQGDWGVPLAALRAALQSM
ncbi:tetratricopeptide repeat protein [Oleispirillum naphthae]|uniref:tetratricopeptide repeat protein n=1 Tax=Oleispirillum naphthae TaxID=2838853 RepID=UPI0030825953